MALVFAALCAAGGLLLLARLGRGLSLAELGAGGVPLGLVGATLVVCGVATVIGFSALAVWSGVTAWLFVTAVLGGGALVDRVRGARVAHADLMVLAIAALPAALLVYLHLRVLVVEDGLLSTHGSTLTDLGSHAAIVSTMATGGVCPPGHPYYASAPLHYHWLADAFSSACVVADGHGGAGVDLGADETSWIGTLRNAVVLPDVVFSLCFFTLLWRLARRCGLSLVGATTTVMLAALGGGVGFFFFAAEHPSDLFSALTSLPAPFDLWPEQGLYWTNLVRDVFLHTRTAAPALCLWLLGILLVLSVDDASLAGELLGAATNAAHQGAATTTVRRLSMTGAGLVLGLLPMLNLHVFVGGLAVTVTWLAVIRPDGWGWVLPPLAIEAGSALAWLWWARTPSLGALTFSPGGWMASGHPVVFWMRNVGPLLLGGAFGGLLLTRSGRALCLASWAAFVVGNLFVLTSPWANEKLMLAWFVLACVGAGAFIERLLTRGRAATALALVLLALSTPTGLFAVGYNLTQSLRLYSPEAAPACAWLSASTPSDAVVLTDDGCATAVCIAGGRRLYVGMPDILTAHGINPLARVARRDGVLMGDDRCGWVLRTENVDYVLIRKGAGPPGLEAYLVGWGCKPVYDDGACAVYRTPIDRFKPTVQPVEGQTLVR